jgi:hypothetical protein
VPVHDAFVLGYTRDPALNSSRANRICGWLY